VLSSLGIAPTYMNLTSNLIFFTFILVLDVAGTFYTGRLTRVRTLKRVSHLLLSGDTSCLLQLIERNTSFLPDSDKKKKLFGPIHKVRCLFISMH
jgi:hypothetical protein